jgi:hypothetical protein
MFPQDHNANLVHHIRNRNIHRKIPLNAVQQNHPSRFVPLEAFERSPSDSFLLGNKFFNWDSPRPDAVNDNTLGEFAKV